MLYSNLATEAVMGVDESPNEASRVEAFNRRSMLSPNLEADKAVFGLDEHPHDVILEEEAERSSLPEFITFRGATLRLDSNTKIKSHSYAASECWRRRHVMAALASLVVLIVVLVVVPFGKSPSISTTEPSTSDPSSPDPRTPEAFACAGVCFDGSPPPYPRFVPEGQERRKELSCEELDEKARELKNHSECFRLQLAHEEQCGCQAPSCTTICIDGSLPNAFNGNEVAYVLDGVEVTCADLQSKASLGTLSQSQCNAYWYLGNDVCGCTNMEGCQLCEDESVADVSHILIPPNDKFPAGYTCMDLAGEAWFLDPYDSNFDEACKSLQALGEYCGCPPPASVDACHICGDGDLLEDTNKPAPSADPILGDGATCFEIERFANGIRKGEWACSDYQLLSQGNCCPHSPLPSE